jgi:hypothetical protein
LLGLISIEFREAIAVVQIRHARKLVRVNERIDCPLTIVKTDIEVFDVSDLAFIIEDVWDDLLLNRGQAALDQDNCQKSNEDNCEPNVQLHILVGNVLHHDAEDDDYRQDNEEHQDVQTEEQGQDFAVAVTEVQRKVEVFSQIALCHYWKIDWVDEAESQN